MQFTEREAAALSRSEAAPAFRADVLQGLGRRPAAIPQKWLYDRRGSQLAEAMTLLPDAHQTRAERRILESHLTEITGMAGAGRVLVEFGAGACINTPALLSALQPVAYIPVDISGEFLRESAGRLAGRFPLLAIHPLEADLTHPLHLPGTPNAPRIAFASGSLFGDLETSAAINLLRSWRDLLGPGSQLLFGIDRLKAPALCLAPYDDAFAVAATFNLNLLHRINRELQGDIPVRHFRHVVLWNEEHARVEMHLAVHRDVSFTVAGVRFRLRKGETIHTGSDKKFREREASSLLRGSGWSPVARWEDAEDSFCVILAESRHH